VSAFDVCSDSALEGIEEFRRLDAEGPREPDYIYKGNVSLAPFDSANVVAMEIREFGEFLLRETPFEAKLADVSSENGSGVGCRHRVIIGLMTTMSLHTMSVVFSFCTQAHCPRGRCSQKSLSCRARPSWKVPAARGWNVSKRNFLSDSRIAEAFSLR